ncbi:interleukin-34 [Trichomycterus rosablanca]|uniref:interleukin-34 n=1 Tax=Trichomycterus rosablanca TaxID=2290929 RepID=UPI002F35CC15
MVHFETWFFKGLLSLIWVLPVWMDSTRPIFCNSVEALRNKLNITLRKRYLKYNFPINYTIQVQYEEIFRMHNISRLMNGTQPVNETHLQWLWFEVTRRGIKHILDVLPERHPTRCKYLNNVESIFKDLEKIYSTQKPEEVDMPESIENIYERLLEENGRRSVTPKSLLDNCYRTMHCLFKNDCFSEDENRDDYCNSHHWKKRKGT